MKTLQLIKTSDLRRINGGTGNPNGNDPQNTGTKTTIKILTSTTGPVNPF